MNRKTGEQSVKIKINTENGDKRKVKSLINNRIDYINDIIRNSLLSIEIYKSNNIFSNSDIHMCTSSLKDLYKKNDELKKNIGVSRH